MSHAPDLLSSTIPCPKCSTPIELDEDERALGTFVCPSCRKQTRDLLVHWEIASQEWRRFGTSHTQRYLMIGVILMIVAGVVMALGSSAGNAISMLFTIAFLVGGGLVLTSIWQFVRSRSETGHVYLYLSGVWCRLDSAKWSIPSIGNAKSSTPRLVDVIVDSSGEAPVMTFTCGASVRDKTSVPVPSDRIGEAEELRDYFVSLMEEEPVE
jgi:hypothetical protein